MAKFYPLKVVNMRRETPDAVVVSLQPSSGAEERFQFMQGQYLTFRKTLDGQELRRSYSICAARGEHLLRVGIKRVDGGRFSTWANENLKIGDTLEAMVPQGRFNTPIEADKERRYLAVAVGSGITPVLSLIKTILLEEPHSAITLVFGNRYISSVMFRQELDELKNLYLNRCSILHIFSRDGGDVDLFNGRLDRARCATIFGAWVDVGAIDHAFVCGPQPLLETVSSVLMEFGLKPEQIKYELFAGGELPKQPRKKSLLKDGGSQRETELTVTIDGLAHRISASPNQTILETALMHDLDAPYSCKAGVCATCRCRILDGLVDMIANHALEDYEVEQGYRLACQSYPRSKTLKVAFDI